MKKIAVPFLCAFLCLSLINSAHAIDFKIRGEWGFVFTAGENRLYTSTKINGRKTRVAHDKFTALQRIRLFLDAAASENLSGSVGFQIGRADWGNASQGTALGADGTAVKVRYAYIDWLMPETDLKTRMGIQTVRLPNKAGGPAVFACRVAGVVSSYMFNENLGLTGLWIRPFNDNYNGHERNGVTVDQGYLDNMDLFGAAFIAKYDGFEINPWIMYGIRGKNTLWQTRNGDRQDAILQRFSTAGFANHTLYPFQGVMGRDSAYSNNSTGKAYGSLFWAGLPLQITALDPWNMELDFNYGYVESMGRYNAYKGVINPDNLKRSGTGRQGWLAKALAEYRSDWGIPGIFGWYASGDDGTPANGSERMPSLAAYGDFTSFILDDYYTLGDWYDMGMDYSGTWGIGFRIKDVPLFTENLKTTVRAAYWGGTNSPSMVKYMNTAYSWNDGIYQWSGPYLTTRDGLLEANWITNYKMYENFLVQMEMGYIANFIDQSLWEKAGARNSDFDRQDAWKVQMKFYYQF